MLRFVFLNEKPKLVLSFSFVEILSEYRAKKEEEADYPNQEAQNSSDNDIKVALGSPTYRIHVNLEVVFSFDILTAEIKRSYLKAWKVVVESMGKK